MKIGIISDIHAQHKLLDRAISELKKRDIDELICLGDIAEDDPDSNKCINLLLQAEAKSVVGYHDRHCIAYNEHLTPKSIDYLKSLPDKIAMGDSIIFVHDHPLGDDYRKKRFFDGEYIKFRYQAKELLNLTKYKHIFVGHTHIPAVFSEDEEFEFNQSGILQLKNDKRYVINPGSICYSRDGRKSPCMGIFDIEKNTFEVIR